MTLRAEELIESREASAPHTVPKERAMRSGAVKFLTKLGDGETLHEAARVELEG